MPAERDSPTVTILQDDSQTDADRIAQLLPLVYEQLRAAAQNLITSERPDHTLQATELVHEAYLRLVGPRDLPWRNRAHFYTAAAEAMRRVLIDHAKSRGRAKRGGGRSRRPLSAADLISDDPAEILALDECVRRLESDYSEAAAVVRLRFYAGLSGDDTAAALGISPRQVDRLWAFARAWLFRAMQQETGAGRSAETKRERKAHPGDRR